MSGLETSRFAINQRNRNISAHSRPEQCRNAQRLEWEHTLLIQTFQYCREHTLVFHIFHNECWEHPDNGCEHRKTKKSVKNKGRRTAVTDWLRTGQPTFKMNLQPMVPHGTQGAPEIEHISHRQQSLFFFKAYRERLSGQAYRERLSGRAYRERLRWWAYQEHIRNI